MRAGNKGTEAGCVESFRFPPVLGDRSRLKSRCGNRQLSWLFQPLDLDTRDAPAIHFHDGEAIAFVVKTLSTTGNKSELRQDETSRCRIGRILRQLDAVSRLEVVQAARCVENHGRIGALPDNE